MSHGEKNQRAEKGAATEKGVARVDRRVRRSRRAIMEALDRLIMDRSFEDITVSALAREADVDRKTFYQHFGSMDGLLDAIAEDAVSGLLDEVELTMASGGGGDEAGALQAFFSALAEHMAKNTTLRQSYFEHMPSELLFERLARPLMRQVVERGLAAGTYSDDELELILTFGLGGLFSLYRWWLLSDRSMPLEELTERACRLLEGGVAPFAGTTNSE